MNNKCSFFIYNLLIFNCKNNFYNSFLTEYIIISLKITIIYIFMIV